jgi:putative transposase
LLAGHLQERYRVGIRRACWLVGLARSSWYHRSRRRDDAPLRKRIQEIAEVRIRYGIWRIYVLLRREGWRVNHKRVHRLYKALRLNLRRKPPRRSKAAAHRLERLVAQRANACWSLGFVDDALFDGRRFRALSAVDNFTEECLAIEVAVQLRSEDVVRVMERLRLQRGLPARIQTDNGSEFASLAMDRWAYEQQVTLDFSRPGKPTDNPFVESFNASFRDECLNTHWFLSLEDARGKIENWRQDYNHFRPHSSLGDRCPAEFAG